MLGQGGNKIAVVGVLVLEIVKPLKYDAAFALSPTFDPCKAVSMYRGAPGRMIIEYHEGKANK